MDQSATDLFHWLSALIAMPAIAYAAQPFFRSAVAALKARRLNMDVPISLGITLGDGDEPVPDHPRHRAGLFRRRDHR